MMIVPRRLARREQIGRQIIGKAAERFENDELRQNDEKRNDPDDEDHGSSATRRRLKVKRVADGVVAFY